MGVGFSWQKVSTDFWVKNRGDVHNLDLQRIMYQLGHVSIVWFSATGCGGGYFYAVVWQFWWFSSSLFYGLMQDVMKSLRSF